MKAVAQRFVLLALTVAACGAPAASSAGVSSSAAPEPAALGSPSAADTREISIEVSGLI